MDRGKAGAGLTFLFGLFGLGLLGALAPARGDEPSPEEEKLRELIAVHVKDLEAAAASTTADGLKVTATYLPDALGYRAAKEYLRRREKGEGHEAAVGSIARLLPGWKKREGMAAVLLEVKNLTPRPRPSTVPAPASLRIYTLQKEFLGTALTLLGPEGKKLNAKLAETPRHLRPAQLRVKKFWVTADGRTLRGAYDPSDPASTGRKPMVSKPTPALLIEENPMQAEVLLKPQKVLPRLVLKDLQRYEGPFVDDHLDLNGGRQWEPIQAIEVELAAPAGGLEPPPALLQLLQEARGGTRKAAPPSTP